MNVRKKETLPNLSTKKIVNKKTFRRHELLLDLSCWAILLFSTIQMKFEMKHKDYLETGKFYFLRIQRKNKNLELRKLERKMKVFKTETIKIEKGAD